MPTSRTACVTSQPSLLPPVGHRVWHSTAMPLGFLLWPAQQDHFGAYISHFYFYFLFFPSTPVFQWCLYLFNRVQQRIKLPLAVFLAFENIRQKKRQKTKWRFIEMKWGERFIFSIIRTMTKLQKWSSKASHSLSSSSFSGSSLWNKKKIKIKWNTGSKDVVDSNFVLWKRYKEAKTHRYNWFSTTPSPEFVYPRAIRTWNVAS